ncbi:MAG: hypothetical protein GX575_33075 [Candidatus Anammoximicrobium sp.]|nr:hypothetical protein [Candidatus Anammoximicrobium sp.]
MSDITFAPWKTMAELQLKFVEARGVYQKNAAEAELRNAQAAYELARTKGELANVRAKEAFLKQVQLDLARMNRRRRQMEKRIDLIADMAKNAAMIRNGERLHSSLLGPLWQGYNYFTKFAPQSVLDEIMETAIDRRARTKTNFVVVRDKSTADQDVAADIENVLELIEWVRTNRYMPKKGKPAYRQITSAFGLIAAVAEPEIAKLQEALQEIDKGVHDAWKPIELLGLQWSSVSPPPGRPATT